MNRRQVVFLLAAPDPDRKPKNLTRGDAILRVGGRLFSLSKGEPRATKLAEALRVFALEAKPGRRMVVTARVLSEVRKKDFVENRFESPLTVSFPGGLRIRIAGILVPLEGRDSGGLFFFIGESIPAGKPDPPDQALVDWGVYNTLSNATGFPKLREVLYRMASAPR